MHEDQRPLQASFDPPAFQIRIIKVISHQFLPLYDAQLRKNLIPGILIEVTQHNPPPWNGSILPGFHQGAPQFIGPQKTNRTKMKPISIF